MSKFSVDQFAECLPGVFEPQINPTEHGNPDSLFNGDDDWIFMPVPDVQTQVPPEFLPSEKSNMETGINEGHRAPPHDQLPEYLNFTLPPEFPGQATSVQFPGGFKFPGIGGDIKYPPPDALAFYLPAHYYHPTWWGIYLIEEGVRWLANLIRSKTKTLSEKDAYFSAQHYLFKHEAFHASVESFAFRLEASHRKKIYCKGFADFFKRTVNTDHCLEEALAEAKAITETCKLKFLSGEKRKELKKALIEYVKGCGPGYRRGVEFLKREDFDACRRHFWEENWQECFPDGTSLEPGAWRIFTYCDSPIIRINSTATYLVRRDSELAKRTGLDTRYRKKPRDIIKKLKEFGCSFVRQGRGSHEYWTCPNSLRKFPIAKHRRDMPTGTLRAIAHQAGLTDSQRKELMG